MIFKNIKNFISTWFNILSIALSNFSADNVLKLCASLSYYTLIALPPLLMIVISVLGMMFGKDAVQGKVFGEINTLIGNGAAMQVQQTLKNVKLNNNNALMAVFSGFLLLLSASGVFAEIQSSIQIIWNKNQTSQNSGIVNFIRSKLMSMAMLASIVFLLLVSLFISSIIEILGTNLTNFFHHEWAIALYITNIVISFTIITALFLFIYYTLPSEKIGWRFSIISSVSSAILFMIGKFFIGLYLSKSDVGSAYGASGSIIVLMVWVYYSSAILYFGTEVGKAYAKHYEKLFPKTTMAKI